MSIPTLSKNLKRTRQARGVACLCKSRTLVTNDLEVADVDLHPTDPATERRLLRPKERFKIAMAIQ